MSKTTLNISWKDPVNRGAVLSVVGVSLVTQAFASAYAIFIYQLGSSMEELVFVTVVAVILAITLAVIILTGFEYLNENKTDLKYSSISGIAIIVLVVFMGTYSWGFEFIKGFLKEFATTPADLTYLISQGLGLVSVFLIFYLFHFWNKITASMKL
ncbi:MAG: hypothetical protein ACFFD4_31255 [Candidatus Odinarchaeota archaeon]